MHIYRGNREVTGVVLAFVGSVNHPIKFSLLPCCPEHFHPVFCYIGRKMMTITKISVNCLGLTSIARVMSHYQPKLHASLRDAKGKAFKIYHTFYPYVKFDPPFPWVPCNDPCKTSGSLFLRV